MDYTWVMTYICCKHITIKYLGGAKLILKMNVGYF